MPSKKKQTFETHLAALEEIVDALKSGELDLETALARYEDGVKRLKSCYEMLQSAEQRVQKLVGDQNAVDGGAIEEPFDEGDE
jgi:exodeoxyribonuclease VII small subunit